MSRSRAALLAAGIFAISTVPAAAQGGVSVTDAQLLATFGGAGEDEARWTATLQHFSTWRHGTNFFFLDVTDEPGLDFFEGRPGLYLEYAPVIGLRSLGVPVPSLGGALRDVGATVQVNTGWTRDAFPIDRVLLEGVELAWSTPGFAVFNTHLLARQEYAHEPAWQVTWVYDVPFAAGPLRGAVTGFMDVWRSEQEGSEPYLVLLAQPQLLVALGSPEPGASHLEIGVEVEPSHDFPARFVSDGWSVAVSPMVRWVF
jgi:hypothetical protein